MEKVLQILAVFALLMLLIWRSIRGRDERFRRLSYLGKLRPPLEVDIRQRLVEGVFDRGREAVAVPEDVDGYLVDEEGGMLLCYRREGKLTIYRRSRSGIRELQELSVPMDCTGLWWDPEEKKLYLEEAGDLFVYGPED